MRPFVLLTAVLATACPQFIEEIPDAAALPATDAGDLPEDASSLLEDAGEPAVPDAGDGGGEGLDAGHSEDASLPDDAGIPSDAGASDDAGSPEDAGEEPQIECTVDKPRIRANEPANITCVAPADVQAVWSVLPEMGAQIVNRGSGCARFHLPSSALSAGFGDTRFVITGTFEVAPPVFVSRSVEVLVLGNIWVGRGDIDAIDAFSSDGTRLGTAIGPALLDNRPRALAMRADGAILVAQGPIEESDAAVVVVSRGGLRLGEFENSDFSGAPLFTRTLPPRAILQARDGTIWVTGDNQPVIFDANGQFLKRAAQAPGKTQGIAQLADGRIVVTYLSRQLGIYSEDGDTLSTVDLALSPDPYNYTDLQALAVEADGSLLVSCNHYQTGTPGSGTIMRLSPAFTVVGELPAQLREYQNVSSHLLRFEDEIITSPQIGHGTGQCPRRYDISLSSKLGCLGDGMGAPQYRGLVQLAAP